MAHTRDNELAFLIKAELFGILGHFSLRIDQTDQRDLIYD